MFQSQKDENDPNYGIAYLSCVSTGSEHMWDTPKDSQKYLWEVFKDLKSCIVQVWKELMTLGLLLSGYPY